MGGAGSCCTWGLQQTHRLHQFDVRTVQQARHNRNDLYYKCKKCVKGLTNSYLIMIHLFMLGLARKEIVLQRHAEKLSEAKFLLSWRRPPTTVLPRWPTISDFIACHVLLARLQIVGVPLRAYRADLRARFSYFLSRKKITHHYVAIFLKYGRCTF